MIEHPPTQLHPPATSERFELPPLRLGPRTTLARASASAQSPAPARYPLPPRAPAPARTPAYEVAAQPTNAPATAAATTPGEVDPANAPTGNAEPTAATHVGTVAPVAPITTAAFADATRPVHRRDGALGFAIGVCVVVLAAAAALAMLQSMHGWPPS